MDGYDRKILLALQDDGRLTNAELSERVNLSPSQCSRRRARLEAEGVIQRYGARLDRSGLGFGLATFISVTLATHNRDNAQRFARLVDGCPEVLEAHALTGEMDYLLKVVVKDLMALSAFVNDTLLPHDSVLNVKTSIVLETLKETSALPL